MGKRSYLARRGSFEALENRRLMAGDVFARIDRGNLVIRGDNADNGIQILAGQAPGEVLVLGTQVFGIETRVNGVEGAAVPLTGFSGKIDIALNGGSDRVRIESFTSRGITADLGRGTESRFELYNHTINGDLSVKSLEGNDLVILNDNTVNGSVSVDMGDGLNTLNTKNDSVSRDAKFIGGRGGDNFTFLNLSAVGNFTTIMGDGANDVDALNISANRVVYTGGKNSDSFFMEAGGVNSVTAQMGQGDNKVDLHGPRIRGDLCVTAGSGNDEVIADENFVDGSATINLGDGNNRLQFQMHVQGNLTVCGGRGADNIDLDGQYVDGPVIYRSLKVDLGDGVNTFDLNQAGSKGVADVRTGKDSDTFSWTDVSFGALLANMGSGDNQFNAFTIAVAREFSLTGSKGADNAQIFPATLNGKTTIDLGDGSNRLDFGNAEVRGDFVFRTGSGSDTFIATGVHFFKSLRTETGNGSSLLSFSGVAVDGRWDHKTGDHVDNVQLVRVSLTALNMALGRGDDRVIVDEVTSTQKAAFDGGPGTDTYSEVENFPSTFNKLDRKSFEIIDVIGSG